MYSKIATIAFGLVFFYANFGSAANRSDELWPIQPQIGKTYLVRNLEHAPGEETPKFLGWFTGKVLRVESLRGEFERNLHRRFFVQPTDKTQLGFWAYVVDFADRKGCLADRCIGEKYLGGTPIGIHYEQEMQYESSSYSTRKEPRELFPYMDRWKPEFSTKAMIVKLDSGEIGALYESASRTSEGSTDPEKIYYALSIDSHLGLLKGCASDDFCVGEWIFVKSNLGSTYRKTKITGIFNDFAFGKGYAGESSWFLTLVWADETGAQKRHWPEDAFVTKGCNVTKDFCVGDVIKLSGNTAKVVAIKMNFDKAGKGPVYTRGARYLVEKNNGELSLL